MRKLIKWMLRLLFRDYQFNRIYTLDLPSADTAMPGMLVGGAIARRMESRDEFALSADERIRQHAWYLDQHAHVYGVFEGAALACVCAFWVAGHPRMPGRFPALQEHEAVMVDLLTAPECRGKGYALAITRFAEQDLLSRGYHRLWTWVWHNNIPSIRVFAKAGWIYAYFLVEIQLHGMKTYLRARLPASGN